MTTTTTCMPQTTLRAAPRRDSRPWLRMAALLTLAAGLWLQARPAHALDLAIGEGKLLTVQQGTVGTVSLADPTVADVQVPSPNALLVVGKRAGSTTLYALDENGKPLMQQRIVVTHDLTGLQSVLRARFPKLKLTMSSAPGSLLVDGNAPDAQTAEAVANTIRPFLGEKDQLINRMAITSPTQVQLRVRIAEVKRDVTQALGVNWNVLWGKGNGGPGSGAIGFLSNATLSSTPAYSLGFNRTTNVWNINGIVDALDQEGLISVLAEPNLSAVSGQTASFLAGGEFPVPVSQERGAISVEFKPFGVALDFTPTVLSDDRISMKVRPEVSQVDYTNAAVLMIGDGTTPSLQIPGLSVRRVETTVEMASGESFVIGGLLQNNIRDMVSQIPGLGRLPILGKLFSSSDYMNNKSELVVIVTPFLVRPARPGSLATPLDSMRPATDIEYILHKKIGLDPITSSVPRLTGSAGFVY
ncbi:type II and III secretion system protein family protein [uncultured Castellaniella sp.]|uniref:type II and III secretion system protein family protein n=1 Tax=uncultured Castellaniella sp. TaxID=647907 RepID=UPI002633F514|nr:type II and III secretion system protein family protein [uncultured Castellaniella sp.]